MLRLQRIPDAWLGRFCADTDTDIEPTAAQAAAFRRDAIHALRRVDGPRLRARRDACLHAFERAPG